MKQYVLHFVTNFLKCVLYDSELNNICSIKCFHSAWHRERTLSADLISFPEEKLENILHPNHDKMKDIALK